MTRYDISLSGTRVPPPTWTGEEPCQRVPDVFHPERGDAQAGIVAKWVCRLCPSQVECFTWAMADPTLEGIHAGTTRNERRKLRSER